MLWWAEFWLHWKTSPYDRVGRADGPKLQGGVDHRAQSVYDSARSFCGEATGTARLIVIDHLSRTWSDLPFEVFSQRYERGSIMVTTNLPFDEWTEVFGSERLTGALLDRLTHHVHILEMNGESYRLKRSRENAAAQAPDESDNP